MIICLKSELTSVTILGDYSYCPMKCACLVQKNRTHSGRKIKSFILMKHGLKTQESYIFKSKKMYINLLTFKNRSPSCPPRFQKIPLSGKMEKRLNSNRRLPQRWKLEILSLLCCPLPRLARSLARSLSLSLTHTHTHTNRYVTCLTQNFKSLIDSMEVAGDSLYCTTRQI